MQLPARIRQHLQAVELRLTRVMPFGRIQPVIRIPPRLPLGFNLRRVYRCCSSLTLRACSDISNDCKEFSSRALEAAFLLSLSSDAGPTFLRRGASFMHRAACVTSLNIVLPGRFCSSFRIRFWARLAPTIATWSIFSRSDLSVSLLVPTLFSTAPCEGRAARLFDRNSCSIRHLCCLRDWLRATGCLSSGSPANLAWARTSISNGAYSLCPNPGPTTR